MFERGLIAAVHTPFDDQGELNVEAIALQAEFLLGQGVRGAFVAGSTGECHSLTVDERMQLAKRWVDVAAGSSLEVLLHVGHHCQKDAITLARQAADLGADAVAAVAPSYFKPASIEDLIDFLVPIASAAGDVPFYYYDIPSLTGICLPASDVLEAAAARIPNLRGLKFSYLDLPQLQLCLQSGKFEVLFGSDDALLAAIALGVQGAVGGTYNFAAGLYLEMLAAVEAGRSDEARRLQAQAVEMVRVLVRPKGFISSSKVVMRHLGIDCGPVRSPLGALDSAAEARLLERLEPLAVLPSPRTPSRSAVAT